MTYDPSKWHTNGCGEILVGSTVYYTDPSGEESGVYEIDCRTSTYDDPAEDEFTIIDVASVWPDGSYTTHHGVERQHLEALYPVKKSVAA